VQNGAVFHREDTHDWRSHNVIHVTVNYRRHMPSARVPEMITCDQCPSLWPTNKHRNVQCFPSFNDVSVHSSGQT